VRPVHLGHSAKSQSDQVKLVFIISDEPARQERADGGYSRRPSGRCGTGHCRRSQKPGSLIPADAPGERKRTKTASVPSPAQHCEDPVLGVLAELVPCILRKEFKVWRRCGRDERTCWPEWNASSRGGCISDDSRKQISAFSSTLVVSSHHFIVLVMVPVACLIDTASISGQVGVDSQLATSLSVMAGSAGLTLALQRRSTPPVVAQC
jgi:hypothetical protein